MSVLPVSSLAMAEPQSPHLELTRPLCACEHTWEMCSPPWSRRGWAGWRESVSTMSRVPFPRPCPCGCRAVAPASSTALPDQIPGLPPGAASTEVRWASGEQSAMSHSDWTHPPDLWPSSLLS